MLKSFVVCFFYLNLFFHHYGEYNCNGKIIFLLRQFDCSSSETKINIIVSILFNINSLKLQKKNKKKQTPETSFYYNT